MSLFGIVKNFWATEKYMDYWSIFPTSEESLFFSFDLETATHFQNEQMSVLSLFFPLTVLSYY